MAQFVFPLELDFFQFLSLLLDDFIGVEGLCKCGGTDGDSLACVRLLLNDRVELGDLRIAPIDFDSEDEELRLGASRIVDLSQKSLRDLSACVGCGRCQEACPAAQTGKALSPKTVMLACADYLAQGKIDDAQMIDDIGAEAIFDCTTCACLLYTSPSPRDRTRSRMPSSA